MASLFGKYSAGCTCPAAAVSSKVFAPLDAPQVFRRPRPVHRSICLIGFNLTSFVSHQVVETSRDSRCRPVDLLETTMGNSRVIDVLCRQWWPRPPGFEVRNLRHPAIARTVQLDIHVL